MDFHNGRNRDSRYFLAGWWGWRTNSLSYLSGTDDVLTAKRPKKRVTVDETRPGFNLGPEDRVFMLCLQC